MQQDPNSSTPDIEQNVELEIPPKTITTQAPSASFSSSSSSTSSSSGSGSGREKRPKRTTSLNVDYDLKKRRIIFSEDDKLVKRNNNHNAQEANAEDLSMEEKIANFHPVERNSDGEIVSVNDEPVVVDPKNGATGLPLGQGPPEKTKKESLWNYKKNSVVTTPSTDMSTNEQKLNEKLETKVTISLTRLSQVRKNVKPVDIHERERRKTVKPSILNSSKENYNHTHSTRTKAVATKEGKSKLFAQNSLAALNDKEKKPSSSPTASETENGIENDDFCSTCQQTGSFLCCDTCPRSFHFLCLSPPIDPDNLPEGDWSCNYCKFRRKYQNATQYKKAQKHFIRELEPKNKLFGSLLFHLESLNTLEFALPTSVKDSFANIKSESTDVYSDDRDKEPLSEKQIFGTPYGQSITKLDSYCPDTHIEADTGKILICYKCGTTKMGTWDSYERDSRLLMKCDYCNTPWHLDCIPDVPRASFKNLGRRWKCPLHAPAICSDQTNTVVKPQRRLTKNQKYKQPLQNSGYTNSGDIEVVLDEITAPPSKDMIQTIKTKGDLPPITKLDENSIKLDFIDKIYKAKKVQREMNMKYNERVIDRLISSSGDKANSTIKEVATAIKSKLKPNSELSKLWNLRELCDLAGRQRMQQRIEQDELKDLWVLKSLLEAKPKDEVLAFLDLNKE